MNEPVANSERYPLQEILLHDLCNANKTIIFLMLAIVVTALSTIWITHQTRLLVAEKGELVFEEHALNNEYVNLQLEESTLSDNSRIEAISTVQFGMQRVKPEQEVVILE